IPSCSYSLTPTNVPFGWGGGSGTVQISAPASCPWIATTEVPWITVTAAAGTGNGSISYSVSPNYTASPRTGTVWVSGQTHAVQQAGITPAQTRFSPSMKTSVISEGTGWQELIYVYDTGFMFITPYQQVDGFVSYNVPYGQWLGIYHYDYGTGRFSQGLYVVKLPLGE
nr:BACON domain-containing protein [Gemmatimonadota bacterium]